MPSVHIHLSLSRNVSALPYIHVQKAVSMYVVLNNMHNAIKYYASIQAKCLLLCIRQDIRHLMLTCKVVTVATITHKMQHQCTNGVTDEPFKNVPSKNVHVLGFNTIV